MFLYLFDSSSGQLTSVGGYVHNVTLTLHYTEGKLHYIEHSNSGKRLSINYTTSGLIRSIELLNAGNTVEEALYVLSFECAATNIDHNDKNQIPYMNACV